MARSVSHQKMAQLTRDIEEFFVLIKVSSLTHDQVLSLIEEKVYSKWQGLPMYQRYYLKGFMACLDKQRYISDLVWGWQTYEGKLYKRGDVIPKDVWEKITREEIKGHHFWKHSGKVFA